MKINDEIIERLAMDQACGELTADAAALLNVWLENNPAAQQRAEKITATFQLTESTVQQKVNSILISTAAPSRPMPRLSKLSLLLPRITQAAIILIALTLGLCTGRLSNSVNRADPTSSKPTVIYQINDGRHSNNSLMKKNGFWHNYLIASAQPRSFPPPQKLIQNDNNFWPDINQIKENHNHSKN
ncbi:MAG: hypothetical protein JXD22_05300 [Sedimentisphaerales bacterium]|nr:hypothetical protein [Sedimentisphaerales bacterium]